MRYWLIKSEGDCYSIDDLRRDKTIPWEGVRNYQARNFMRDDMQVGDLALFYHSNGTPKAPTGVYGIAKVAHKAHPDLSQFDKRDIHYDPKALRQAQGKLGKNPIWECVDFSFVKKFKEPITLQAIKFDPALRGIMVAEQGSRLSIQPVSDKHFRHIAERMAL